MYGLNSIKIKKSTNLYTAFMEEYKAFGHMTQIVTEREKGVSYYIPHHAIWNDV